MLAEACLARNWSEVLVAVAAAREAGASPLAFINKIRLREEFWRYGSKGYQALFYEAVRILDH